MQQNVSASLPVTVSAMGFEPPRLYLKGHHVCDIPDYFHLYGIFSRGQQVYRNCHRHNVSEVIAETVV